MVYSDDHIPIGDVCLDGYKLTSSGSLQLSSLPNSVPRIAAQLASSRAIRNAPSRNVLSTPSSIMIVAGNASGYASLYPWTDARSGCGGSISVAHHQRRHRRHHRTLTEQLTESSIQPLSPDMPCPTFSFNVCPRERRRGRIGGTLRCRSHHTKTIILDEAASNVPL